jgi:large subunit ribosomal protein L21
MFAVVDISGQQFKVVEKETYYVPKLKAEPEQEMVFESVVLFADDNGTKVGTPFVNGIKVHAKVLDSIKDDKIIVFKKKRRISYRRLKGHRQELTKIEITKIA